MNLPPKALARQEIDRQLAEAGWVVQDYGAMNIHAAEGVATRFEGPTSQGYLHWSSFAVPFAVRSAQDAGTRGFRLSKLPEQSK